MHHRTRPALCILLASLYLPACLAQSPQPDQTASITRRLVEKKGRGDDIDQLAQILKHNPDDFRVHFALGRAYESIGMLELADQEDEICAKAGSQFQRYIFGLFKERVDARDYAGATTLFRYVEKHFPEEPSVLLVGALILDHQGRLAEAEENLYRVLKRNSQEPGIYTFLGYLRLKQQRYDEALECFDKELAVRPAFAEALIGKGKIAESKGRYTTALRTLAPIYRDDPLRKGIADSIADCLVRTNMWADAATPSLFAIASASKEGELRRAKERVKLIWPHLSAQVKEDAIKQISAYINSPHDLVRARHFRFAFADALKKAGLWQEAQKQFAAGLHLEPDHARAYFHLAEIAQYREHAFAKAIMNYTAAFNLMPPENPIYADSRATIQARIKRLSALINERRQKDIAGRIKLAARGGSSINSDKQPGVQARTGLP